MISPDTIGGFRDEFQKLANPLAQAVGTGWQATATSPLWKGLQVLGIGFGAKDALKKQDPTGVDRSRFERFGQFAGGTLGNLAGMGLATKHFPRSKWIAPIAGSMLGQAVGERVVTNPLVHRRMSAENQAMRQYLTQQNPAPQGVPA